MQFAIQKNYLGGFDMLNSKWQSLAEKAREQINKAVDDFMKHFEVIEDSTEDYDDNENEIEIPFWVVRNSHKMNTAEWRAEIEGSPEDGYGIQYFDYTEREGLGDNADNLEQAIEVAKDGILERVMPDIEDVRVHDGLMEFFLENISLPEGFEIDDIYFDVVGSQYFTVQKKINDDETIRFRVTIRDHEIKESTLEHGDLDIAIFVPKSWDVEEVAWAFQEIEEKISKKAAKILEEKED